MRFFAEINLFSKSTTPKPMGTGEFLFISDAGHVMSEQGALTTAYVKTTHRMRIGARIRITGRPTNTTDYTKSVTEVLEVYDLPGLIPDHALFIRNVDGMLNLASNGHYPAWGEHQAYDYFVNAPPPQTGSVLYVAPDGGYFPRTGQLTTSYVRLSIAVPPFTRLFMTGVPHNTNDYPTAVSEVLVTNGYNTSGDYYRPILRRDLDKAFPTTVLPQWGEGNTYLLAPDGNVGVDYDTKTAYYDLENVDVTESLRFSTQLHGGFSSASFNMYGTKDAAYERMNKLLNASVVITDGYGRTVWEGFISSTTVNSPGVLEVYCSGFYAKATDRYYDRKFESDEETVNYVYNPAFSAAPRTWAVLFPFTGMEAPQGGADGGAVSPPQVFGNYYANFVQPAGKYLINGLWVPNTMDASYYYVARNLTDEPPINPNKSYTWSFYARSVVLTGLPYVQVYNASDLYGAVAGNMMLNQQLTGVDGTWRRFSFTFTSRSSNIMLVINLPNSRGTIDSCGSLLVSGVQLEEKEYATSYCDGTITGCSWIISLSAPNGNGASRRNLIPVPASTILQDCVGLTLSWENATTFIRWNDLNTGSFDYSDKKLSEVIERVCSFGSNGDPNVLEVPHPTAVYFAIYKHRIPYLITQQQEGDVFVDSNPVWNLGAYSVTGKAFFAQDIGSMYNKVYAIHDSISTGPSYTEAAQDALSQERYGVREGKLQNADTPCKDHNDCSARDIALNKSKFPKMIISLETTGMAEYAGGFSDYPYRIRAGHYIHLTDVDVMAANTGAFVDTGDFPFQRLTKGLYFVLKTDYDAVSNVCRIDIGSSDVSYDMLMSRLGVTGGLK